MTERFRPLRIVPMPSGKQWKIKGKWVVVCRCEEGILGSARSWPAAKLRIASNLTKKTAPKAKKGAQDVKP